MEIEITRYKEAMEPQVIKLFEQQYKVDPFRFGTLFKNFYFHPFQKNKCLLVVALDGDVVAGFQSFFYWPYTFSGKVYNSYQSGNSIVHPAYRGKGIFNKMLAFIEQEQEKEKIDFLMGFPVNESLKNFLKDKWHNILSLKWYVKPCNILGFFSNALVTNKHFKKGSDHFEQGFVPDNVIAIWNDRTFADWRKNYQNQIDHYSFHYKKDSSEIIIHLKRNKRKKIINELIVGAILYNSQGAVGLTEAALEALIKAAKGTFAVHFLSISVNEDSVFNIKNALEKLAFKRTDKAIHFIVKPFKENNFVTEPSRWLLSRSDVDTW